MHTLDSSRRPCFFPRILFRNCVASERRRRPSSVASPATLLAVVLGLVSESYPHKGLVSRFLGSRQISSGFTVYSGVSWWLCRDYEGQAPTHSNENAIAGAKRQDRGTESRTVSASTGTDGTVSSMASVIGVSAWDGESVAAGAMSFILRALRN